MRRGLQATGQVAPLELLVMSRSYGNSPPLCGSPDYWRWAASALMSDDPLMIAGLLGPGAEFGRGIKEACDCGLGREDAIEVAYEYCFDIDRSRHAYEPGEPVRPFLDRLLKRAIARRLRSE